LYLLLVSPNQIYFSIGSKQQATRGRKVEVKRHITKDKQNNKSNGLEKMQENATASG